MRLFSDHPLFTDERVQAFCWTLLHSLWQGILLALLAALVLVFTKKATAAVRYRWLGFLLTLFIGGVLLTFNLQWRHELEKAQTAKITVYVDHEALTAIEDAHRSETPVLGLLNRDSLNAVAAFFNAHAFSICLLWALVFLLKCLKMSLDLYLIRLLRTRGAVAPAQEWLDRVQILAQKTGLRSPLTLLESAYVQVPSVIGVLKPVILLPLGLLAQLPAEQVEAILLHELAHIRRRDFLVNLLQHFTETIFFFNPGVLWVSTLLREEREHCCDEMAVAALNHKSGYLNALLHFQELHLSGARYATAFPGTHRGELIYRAQRILGLGNTKTFNNMEKITLISCVFMAGLFWMLPLDNAQAQTKKQEKQNISWINISGEGTEAVPEEMTIKETNGKTYVLKRVDRKVKEMTIDGQKVPDNEIANYADMISKIDAEVEADMAQAERDREQAKLDMAQAERDRAQAQLDMAQAERDREQAMRDREQAEKDREQAMRDREQGELDRVQAEKDRAQAEKDREQGKRDAEQGARDRIQAEKDRAQAEKDRVQAKRDIEQAMRDREQAVKDRAQAERDREQAVRDRAQAELDRAQAVKDRAQAQKDREKMESMIAEMVKDGIIPDRNSLTTLRLNDSTFEVNGKKLSDDLHRKYQAKYGQDANFEVRYNNGNKSSRIGNKVE